MGSLEGTGVEMVTGDVCDRDSIRKALEGVDAVVHAAGIIDTVGIGLIFLGLAFQAGWTLVLAKLAMILVFILFTSPTSCHALCRAAAYSGVHPMHGEQAPAGADVVDDEEDASLKT